MADQLNHLHAYTLKYQKPLSTSLISRTQKLKLKVEAAASTKARQLIQSGVVRSITPKEVATAISTEGFWLLDVRPMWEREKASIGGVSYYFLKLLTFLNATGES